MKKLSIATACAALVWSWGAALAQDNGTSSMFAYATYFICEPEGESRADEIIKTSFKPHYDSAVEQGDILSWSWLQHYVGGTWRRALVLIAEDMDSILDASGALGEIIEDRTPEAGRTFSSICSMHEDYIWQTIDGVGSGAASDDRGSAGFTAYMQCDMYRESRADDLVRDTFGPVYNRHVGDGQLTSWNWLKHHVGGQWRRILVLGASDHKSLMRARDSIVDELTDRRFDRARREMNEICFTHQDYMWDILFQTP